MAANYVFALLACCSFGYAVAFNWGGRAPRALEPLVLGGLLIVWRLVALARKRSVTVFSTDVVWMPILFVLLLMSWAVYEDPVC